MSQLPVTCERVIMPPSVSAPACACSTAPVSEHLQVTAIRPFLSVHWLLLLLHARYQAHGPLFAKESSPSSFAACFPRRICDSLVRQGPGEPIGRRSILLQFGHLILSPPTRAHSWANFRPLCRVDQLITAVLLLHLLQLPLSPTSVSEICVAERGHDDP